jgi:hypothetical protein
MGIAKLVLGNNYLKWKALASYKKVEGNPIRIDEGM